MKARLTGTRARILKSTAVPSIYLKPEIDEQKITERGSRVEKKKNKELVKQLLHKPDEPSNQPELHDEMVTDLSLKDELQIQLEISKKENTELKSKLEEFQNKEKLLTEKIVQLEDSLKQANNMTFEERAKISFQHF